MPLSRRKQLTWRSIIITFFIALVLVAVPLPKGWDPYHIDWLALVLIHWCMYAPNRVGVGTGWILGLLQDVLQFGLLGLNGFSKAVIAYLVTQFHQRLQVLPVWNQAIMVFLLVAFDTGLSLLIRGMMDRLSFSWWMWLPPVLAIVAWPFLSLAIRQFSERPT